MTALPPGGFFDRFPTVPPTPEPDEHVPPVWAQPEHLLGGTVATELVLARSDRAAVGLSRFTVFPNGFAFTVTTMLRHEDRRGELLRRFSLHDFADATPPPEFLRLGVLFADGAAAGNVGPDPYRGPDDEPAGPLLISTSGGGGGRRYDLDHWVWPLPPPGPLTVVCEWPAYGIGESHATIDAGLLHEAAGRAIPLWPAAGRESPQG